MRLISTAIALTAALVATAPAIDIAAAPKPKNVNVKLTFNDGGDRIISDGLGAYEGGAGGVLASILVTDKGQLSFSTGSNRTLKFFFYDCVLLSGCSPTFPTVNDDARLLAHPLRDGVNPSGGLLGMTIAEGELPAFVKIDIPNDLDPRYWNLCFDAGDRFPPCAAVSGHSSTNAHIVRTANDQWTLSATSADRADLVRDSDTRRNRTFTLEGTYAMPFSVTIQCVSSADCP